MLYNLIVTIITEKSREDNIPLQRRQLCVRDVEELDDVIVIPNLIIFLLR